MGGKQDSPTMKRGRYAILIPLERSEDRDAEEGPRCERVMEEWKWVFVALV